MGNVLMRRVGQEKLTERKSNGERIFKRSLSEVHLGTPDRIHWRLWNNPGFSRLRRVCPLQHNGMIVPDLRVICIPIFWCR